ncbi:MAG: FkbM family methyltransferase, partial [Cyanobacteria bacterium P01_B01_bin.77]
IGSLLEQKTEAFEEQEIVSDATVKNRIIVPTLTVDEMIKQSSKSFSDLNFLYMNIQGSELSALEKAEETLTHLDYIYLEKNIVSRYENCPSPDEIDNFLLEHNFIKEWEYIDQRWGGGFSFYVKP